MSSKVVDLANKVVDRVAGELKLQPDMHIQVKLEDVLFSEVAKATSIKLDLAEFLPEIDLDLAPGGESIYHDIQNAIEKAANSVIQEKIKTDSRFTAAPKATVAAKPAM